jgi:hypothetical protein
MDGVLSRRFHELFFISHMNRARRLPLNHTISHGLGKHICPGHPQCLIASTIGPVLHHISVCFHGVWKRQARFSNVCDMAFVKHLYSIAYRASWMERGSDFCILDRDFYSGSRPSFLGSRRGCLNRTGKGESMLDMLIFVWILEAGWCHGAVV